MLLELIRAHPELPTISDLIIIYLELIEKSPTQIDKLTGALVNLKNSNKNSVAGYEVIQPRYRSSMPSKTNSKNCFAAISPLEDAFVTPSNEYLIPH